MSIEQQFLQAYDLHADAIYRYCFYRVYDRQLAEDLMQETFIRTWDTLRRGTTINYLKAFLYQIAYHLLVDHSRKKQESSLDDLQASGFEPRSRDLNPHQQAEAQEALRFIESLEPLSRDVLILHFVEGLKPKEIAKIMDIAPNTVSARISRAKKYLKQSYEPTPQTTSL